MTAARRYVFAGNWKMYKTVPEAVALAREVRAALEAQPVQDEVVVCPPFTALQAVGEALRGSRIGLGAQNMHAEKEGAFTGETSPLMLRDLGCTYVILGHSERRHIFEETDEGVGRKARAACDHGLTPLLCVGETLAERESGRTLEVVERQVERALRFLTPDEAGRVLVSYEPVWAIGTGKVATPEQAEDVQAFIRKRVALSHGDPPAEALRILYGGSVKPENTENLMAQGDIDGLLVGGASLKADSFLGIVRNGRR
jgi:triosephosphate isomerase (TIM)